MNEMGTLLLWCAIQSTLSLVIGALVYLCVRRFGPATGAWAVLSTLVVLCGVTAAAFSPWPRWRSPWSNDAQAAVDGTDIADRISHGPTEESSLSDAVLRADRSEQGGVSLLEYWDLFRMELEAASRATPAGAASRRWPKIVALIFIAGAALALVRMSIGIAALARYRRQLCTITDPDLTELAQAVARSLDCRRPVELKQSASLATPATMGWLRPVIVLPADWPTWSDLERRVVLAHEMAHIARGDYLTWLMAQVSVALHVYHPLVHWLAGRLRLEQELAADACAAEVSGGRENYLYTLAQMALRQDDRSVAWAARPFLPSRGTLLRRVEMLSETKRLENRPLTRRRAVALAGVAAIVALAVSGIRAPLGGAPPAQAAPPAKPPALPGVVSSSGVVANAGAIELSYVPPSAVAVFALRPASLLAKADMQPLVKLLEETANLKQHLAGLKIDSLEQVTFVVTRLPEADQPHNPDRFTLKIFRYNGPFDWKGKFGASFVGKPVEATIGGKTYYHSGHSDQAVRPAFYMPDERTVVVGPEIDLQRMILSGERRQPDWAGDWQKWAAGHAAAMVDVSAIGRVINEASKRHPLPPAASVFSPIWEKGQRLYASAKAEGGLTLAASIQAASAQDADRIQGTLQAALTLARNMLDEADRHLSKASATQAAAMVPLIDLAGELLKQGNLTSDETAVNYSTTLDLDVAETAITVMAPAVVAARQAAQQAHTANNLKQIMLALHNYHDVKGHFPPPVAMGPDGKTPHSWRVEILPYLEQQELYKQYRMEEPWDSDNNKKLLAQIPQFFRDPQGDPTKSETSYLALVGAATALGPKDGTGTKIQEIPDGTSNTMALVESKRAVPWTKPEDIDYDPAKPLPVLGGRRPGGLWAAFCDGSVRFLADSLDQQKLHALITKAGGELITSP